MTNKTIQRMRAGAAAPGIDTWKSDAVSDMTAQESAVGNAPTAGLSYSVAVSRAWIQQFVQHLAAWVVEIDNRLPLLGILGAATQLACLLHDPGEV